MSLLIETICQRWRDEDDIWVAHSIRPADLRLRVWSNNLVSLEFIAADDTAQYRLCWNAFRQFVEDIAKWLFKKGHQAFRTCIDPGATVYCMPHVNYGVSITFGHRMPEFGFCASRDQFLAMVDEVARFLSDLPDVGCYDPNSTVELIIIN